MMVQKNKLVDFNSFGDEMVTIDDDFKKKISKM